jgi:hypothetical protein
MSAKLRTPFAGMSKELAKSLFDYKDGILYWKVDRAKIKTGDIAGANTSHGYKRVMVNYKEYPLHSIVYLLHFDFIPEVIDHIDGNPLNNSIENLREASYQTNQYNRKRGINNTSGCKNVSWSTKKQVWQIHIRHNKKVRAWYIKDFELAELIAYEARELFHGKFANHVC